MSPNFDAFLTAVLALRPVARRAARPRRFQGHARQRELIGDMAIVDPTAGGNPLQLTRARALEIFDRAMDGRL